MYPSGMARSYPYHRLSPATSTPAVRALREAL